ncbi:MAG: PAS domain-containing protein, partial [Elusimicrobiota bacterium]
MENEHNALEFKNVLEYSKSIVATHREPCLTLNKDLQVISANQAFYTKFKISKKETVGEPIDEIGNSEWDIPKLLTLLKDILPKKKIVKDYAIEHKFKHTGKRELLVNAYRLNIPVKTELEKKKELILLSIEYIAKKKRYIENLLESKNELFQILQGVTMPTFVIDKNHQVIYWNKACEKLTGIPVKEVEGTEDYWKAFYDTKRPVMADLIVEDAGKKEFEKYYENKYTKSPLMDNAYEAEDFFPDFGEEGRWIYFSAAPLRNSKGEKIGAIEILKDISERKQTEKRLRTSREE